MVRRQGMVHGLAGSVQCACPMSVQPVTHLSGSILRNPYVFSCLTKLDQLRMVRAKQTGRSRATRREVHAATSMLLPD